ncbi:MAG: hypothetical protein ACXWUG_24210 [Polyangiales bacterium]
MKTKRLSASSIALLRDAAGPPHVMAAKVVRLLRAVAAYGDARSLDARLERLRGLGLIQEIPTRLQLVVGALDMLRFFIVPAAADYYASKGIDFRFHQVLRFLDDPASLVDPTGFLSARDVIIGHLMQVVHANPRYDLQLLESHEGGLDDLEAQVLSMLEGTHPRARSIGAIIEDPGYHARLLDYVRAYKRDRDSLAPVRENISSGFAEAERNFGTLPSAMRYFASLPRDLTGALGHLRRNQMLSS